MQTAEPTADEAIKLYVEAAAEQLSPDHEITEILESSYREISVQVPIRRDDGSLLVVKGYRVQHNGGRGKGQPDYHDADQFGVVAGWAIIHQALAVNEWTGMRLIVMSSAIVSVCGFRIRAPTRGQAAPDYGR
ncbi:hypothetical protein [Nesterenkonia muleiensis]|uniref:hypothetical protein n=1 Tax=Nesterenkonia muleiensis TaxID=2282648 RepID=UPI001300384C|nr:hypothetical protein [Nesterenkonia muleiensis]